jgi:ribosome-binding protein aMBF1 (putative translation factor)
MDYLNKIRKAVSSSDIPRKDIARALNIKYDTFRRKLNGETDFKVKEIINLCTILKINILEVFENVKES